MPAGEPAVRERPVPGGAPPGGTPPVAGAGVAEIEDLLGKHAAFLSFLESDEN